MEACETRALPPAQPSIALQLSVQMPYLDSILMGRTLLFKVKLMISVDSFQIIDQEQTICCHQVMINNFLLPPKRCISKRLVGVRYPGESPVEMRITL